MQVRIAITCLTLLTLLSACDRRSADESRSPRIPADRATSNTTALVIRREPTRLVKVRVSQFQMGMMVHLTIWAPSIDEGHDACAAAFRRVREIDLAMSDYEPTSELSRLCRQAGQGPIPVSDELFEVLAAARRLAELTDGQYDPTVGPVVRLWRAARQTATPPDPAALQQAMARVGYQQLRLDPEHQTAELTRPGMLLDLGSIAKGYAGDQALALVRQLGITRAVFEAGGDKVFGDPPPHSSGWKVRPDHPDAPPLNLANCAVSISGDTIQYFEFGGKRYGHVIDPRSGQAITSRRMCIAIAPRGITSDPLATIGTIMPTAQYETLLERHFPGLRTLLLSAPSGDIQSKPRVGPPTYGAKMLNPRRNSVTSRGWNETH